MKSIDKSELKVKIQNGKLLFYNVDLFKKLLADSEGFEGFISFNSFTSDSSTGHRRLYDWWLKIIEEETGNDKIDSDIGLRQLFLKSNKGTKQVILELDDLDYKKTIEFLEKVFIWASESQIELPKPSGWTL